ncbi:MAG: DRTGG domain-containing protein [bacterium]
MQLADVARILRAEILVPPPDIKANVSSACAADLMSDVLTFIRDRTLLLTGLTTTQVIRTASLIDLAGIVFVRGKRPGPEVLELAREHGLPVFLTRFPMYESCGLLYKAGLEGHMIGRDDANGR